jgi:tRNA (guanine-N7-)-methyltransferase
MPVNLLKEIGVRVFLKIITRWFWSWLAVKANTRLTWPRFFLKETLLVLITRVNNVGFLRIQIETLTDYFAPGEIDEIWITFPDPQPQISREKKRLTSPRFLEKYKLLLKPGGCVNLKTDNDDLYAYTAEKITGNGLKLHIKTEDLYHSAFADEVLAIKTYYEKKYLKDNKNINYLKFSFDGNEE